MRIYGFSYRKLHAHWPVRVTRQVSVAPDVVEEQVEWSLEHLNHPLPLHGSIDITKPHQLQRRTAIEDLQIWCEEYFGLVGDTMPDSHEIHMPAYLTSADIHSKYLFEMFYKGFNQEDLPLDSSRN